MKNKHKANTPHQSVSPDQLGLTSEGSLMMTCSRCGKRFLFEEELELDEEESLSYDSEGCLCPQCEAELRE